MTPTLFWPMLVGCVCAVPCALLGCFLVLRRLSLVGDAISHAVLPGLVLAFLVTGKIQGWPILLGAMLLGVLTVFLTDTVGRLTGASEDTSLGVVFTALFALGVLLITRLASRVDLDPGCVLYGLIEFVSLDTVPFLGFEVPRVLGTMTLALFLTTAFLVAFWKELKLVAFDPGLADAMGYSSVLIHYLLMAMVAAVTVSSFEAVGSILVVAMLIVPAATAHLLTDRLGLMLFWAGLLAMTSAIGGTLSATWLNTNIAGMMAVVSGAQFFLAVLLAPRHGVIGKLAHQAKLSVRIASEDWLGLLYRQEEFPGSQSRPEGTGPLLAWIALAHLRRTGLVSNNAGQLHLTEAGRHRARLLVRGHRLWEAYLQSELALPLDHLHAPAEAMEHFLDPQLQDQLAERLALPEIDPHGKPIPRGNGSP